MNVTVHIPAPLRRLSDGARSVKASGRSVRELLDDLEKRFPGLSSRLTDKSGNLRRFVGIWANGEDRRRLDSLEAALHTGDEVSIAPALLGGLPQR